jgi:hypothetical protein
MSTPDGALSRPFFAEDIRRIILRNLPGPDHEQDRLDAYQAVCEAPDPKSGRESSRYGLVFIFAVIGSECCIYRQLRLMSGGHTRRKRQRETEAPQKRWGHGNNLPG